MRGRHDVLDSIRRLRSHLRSRCEAGALVGPDVGLRWDFRLLRFVRSYSGGLPPMGRHLFLQTQGYWVRCNARLADATGDPDCEALALSACRRVLALQNPDGSWDYPLASRRHLKATVEGC